jgi:5'-nucleotidase
MSLEVGGKDHHLGLEPAARFAATLARAILEEGLPANSLLNVNVPNGRPLQGARWTRLGKRVYRDQVDARKDLRGRSYFWIGGPEVDVSGTPDSDGIAVRDGFVSITPLDLDLTSHRLLEQLPSWNLPGFEAILAR